MSTQLQSFVSRQLLCIAMSILSPASGVELQTARAFGVVRQNHSTEESRVRLADDAEPVSNSLNAVTTTALVHAQGT